MKNIFVFILIFGYAFLLTAKNKNSSDIYGWTVGERLGEITITEFSDTAVTNYQNNNPVNILSIAPLYNGNLGSPIESKLDIVYIGENHFPFLYPFEAYISPSNELLFYNTKRPFSNLTYLSGGPTGFSEEYLKGFVSINGNKNLNFTGIVNLLNAKGRYDRQATEHIRAHISSNYTGKRYSIFADASFNNLKNQENGGIIDDTYITDREKNREYNGKAARSIPVKIGQAESYLRNYNAFLNHKYSLGIDKEIKMEDDSVRTEFIPVTTFIHSLRFTDSKRKYVEKAIPEGFYDNFGNHAYLNDIATNDSVGSLYLRNTFAVKLNEEFNRLFRFGLVAFIEDEFYTFRYLTEDSTYTRKYENNIRVGAELSKNMGKLFTYNVAADVIVLGADAGDLRMSANANSIIPMGKTELSIAAFASFDRAKASYFVSNYFSNHFKWDNDFSSTSYLSAGGNVTLNLKCLDLGASVNFQNITKYVYFDKQALPAQYSGNIQAIFATLDLNLHVGVFHFENKISGQTSSRQDVIPLPVLAAFSNIYYKGVWFKVLTVQLGVEACYHTAYYAKSYMPATGMFHVQDEKKIGNYPLASVYANFHLKTARFFLKYTHFNQSFSGYNYFSMPHYPLNPASLKIGVSWNFLD